MSEPSRNPQTINKDVWYYEKRGHLEFVVYPGIKNPVCFRVPAYRLRRSLARMGQRPARPARGRKAVGRKLRLEARRSNPQPGTQRLAKQVADAVKALREERHLTDDKLKRRATV